LELVGLKPLKIKSMTKILMISMIVILALSALVFVFILLGQWIAGIFPESGFADWWRLHIIDKDPWEN
jgi:hypothetical protein